MADHETNKLLKGALLLTLAGIVSKILSAGYRIPLQNLTGDLGFYMYQQIYPLLGMILVLALYGLPSAISKIRIELRSAGKGASLRQFYIPIFLILFVLAAGVAVVLYFNAERIAIFTGDVRLTRTYQWAAGVFLFVPFTVLLRGMFQADMFMKPIAYSQMSEQLVRVSVIIFGAYLFYIQKLALEHIGEVAVVASILGAIAAILILVLYFIRSKPFTQASYKIPWGYYVRTICAFGVVASMNHMVLLIIQLADVFTLVPHLLDYGLSDVEARIAKGVLDRAQPLIQLGTVLGSSFALALVPMVTKTYRERQDTDLQHYVQEAFLFTVYLAAGAFIGLVLIFPETNVLLFQDRQGTVSLQIIALAIILSSMSITIAAILQGLGSFKRTALYIVGAFGVKWLANGLFVPWLGMAGGALATVFSLLLLMVALLCELKRALPDVALFKKVNGKAFIIAASGMVLFLIIMKGLWPFAHIMSRGGLLIYVMGLALIGAFIYFILLLRCRAFNENELHALPFSTLWIKLHKRRDVK